MMVGFLCLGIIFVNLNMLSNIVLKDVASGVVEKEQQQEALAVTGQQQNPGGLQLQEKEYKVGLDFFIMGWPKTGTSSLMRFLDSSDELKVVVKPEDAYKNGLAEFRLKQDSNVSLLFDQIKQAHRNSVKDGERYGIK